jgi:hypothetical protein
VYCGLLVLGVVGLLVAAFGVALFGVVVGFFGVAGLGVAGLNGVSSCPLVCTMLTFGIEPVTFMLSSS